MQARDGTIISAGPAWPTLVGIQLVLCAALVGAWWRLGAAPRIEHSPVEAQVLDLDPARSAEAVHAALLQQQRAARALLPEDQTRTTGFLALTASAAGMELQGSDWSSAPDPGQAGVEQVDARVRLRGHAFDLPVFLDGLHRQSATVRVRSLALAMAPGGQIEAVVQLRYHRPSAQSDAAVDQRVQRTVPAADPAVRQVLSDARELATMRRFARHAAQRASASTHARGRLAQELPAALVELHPDGGTVTWSESSGIVLQAAGG